MDIVVKLVGVEARDYTDKNTGELKHYAGLHVVHQREDDGEGMRGVRVETLTCPKSVDDTRLEIGQYYGLSYTMQRTVKGTFARLSGLVPTDKAGTPLDELVPSG